MINGSFGSFDSFKDQFNKSAATLLGQAGPGLQRKYDGSLQIIQESNAYNPNLKGLKPIMTCDVWEHAYYILFTEQNVLTILNHSGEYSLGLVAKRY